MRGFLNNLTVIDYDLRGEVSLSGVVTILNRILKLRMEIKNHVSNECADMLRKALEARNGMRRFEIEQTIVTRIDQYWEERIRSEIMANKYWFDIAIAKEIVLFALKNIGNINDPTVDFFVLVGKEIRCLGIVNYSVTTQSRR
jgi:hypothetical protein